MDNHTGNRDATPLLTPSEAAQRLLEEATRTAARTGGVSGLRPVRVDGRTMFRRSEVDGFARAAFAA